MFLAVSSPFGSGPGENPLNLPTDLSRLSGGRDHSRPGPPSLAGSLRPRCYLANVFTAGTGNPIVQREGQKKGGWPECGVRGRQGLNLSWMC